MMTAEEGIKLYLGENNTFVSDNERNFLREVLDCLTLDHLEDNDWDPVCSGIVGHYRMGWTIVESAAFHRSMVYFSPDLDEDKALIKMKKVQKYVEDRLHNESISSS